MNEPLNFDKMIALVAADELPLEIARAWYQSVKTGAPSGTLLVLPGNDNGTPKRVSMLHRTVEGRHAYIVPLSRELTVEEAEVIIEAFAGAHPDLDFEVEATTLSTASPEIEAPAPANIDHGRYQELCTAWAKRQHETWVEERTRGGWRYGAQMSMAQKTHPLLKSWDQLPDAFRKVDTEEPQMLLDLLNAQGYAVITKDELKSLLSLMK